MELDPAVVATTMLVILPAELPDKTFVATLVLSTRFRPVPVWIGVTAAFGVQCLLAVTLGGLLTLLPRAPVLFAASILFGTGAAVLLRSAKNAAADAAEEEREISEAADAAVRSHRRAVVTSFLVLFTAEWGDLSQIITAGLAARSGEPLSVFVGSWVALAIVAALAVAVGNQLARRMPLTVIRRVAAGVFALLAVLTFVEGVRELLA